MVFFVVILIPYLLFLEISVLELFAVGLKELLLYWPQERVMGFGKGNSPSYVVAALPRVVPRDSLHFGIFFCVNFGKNRETVADIIILIP